MYDRVVMAAELRRDEGDRQLYDDATGLEIIPGSVVHGNPTLGVGRDLVSRGISDEETTYLLTNDIKNVTVGLDTCVPWWVGLDDVRQRVLINMGFNLGVQGLLTFKRFLAAMAQHDWPEAAVQMQDSKWFTEVGDRAVRLQQMVLTGQDQ